MDSIDQGRLTHIYCALLNLIDDTNDADLIDKLSVEVLHIRTILGLN